MRSQVRSAGGDEPHNGDEDAGSDEGDHDAADQGLLGVDERSEQQAAEERPDQPDWFLGAEVTDDGRWLLISQSESTDPKNRVFLKDLSDPNGKIEPFLDKFDASYNVVGNDGATFYVVTDKDAPRKRVVAIGGGNYSAELLAFRLPRA